MQGRSQGEHSGHLPPLFPESCNIYHFLPYTEYQYPEVVVKNDHRKADYKLFLNKLSSYTSIEWCLVLSLTSLKGTEMGIPLERAI